MPDPLRILFVEDLPTDQELAAWQLRAGGLDFISRRVETQNGFLQALDEFHPDLVISDYSMPEFDGKQALKLVFELNCEIPFIVLTGSVNEETAVECIKAGASDYVIKEHMHRLPFAVKEALKQHQVRKDKSRAEESLRASEARYRSLFEDSPISLWEEDFSAVKRSLDDLRACGVNDFYAYFTEHPEVAVELNKLVKVLDVNKATLELFGVGTKEEMPRNLETIISPENFEQIRDEFVLIEAGVAQFTMEVINRTLDGRILNLNLNWAAVPGYTNDFSKVIVSMMDITERKQAEAALKKEQYLMRTLMDTIPDTIYFKDTQSRFIRINCAQAKKLGLNDPEQAIGKKDNDFFSVDHAQVSLSDEECIIRTGAPLINSEELLTYPGRESDWVSTTKFPLRDLKGQIIGTFGISRDISDLKYAEEQLFRQSEELRHSNIELTRLYRTSESLISSKPFDLRVLAQSIVDTVVQEFAKSNCSLYLFKKNSNELTRLAYAGEVSEKYLSFKLSADGPGLTALAIRTQHVMNVPDVRSHPDYFDGWEKARSELVIPLYLKDQVIGAIDLESDQLGNFTSDDERLLQIFANQAAIILENTNLIAETDIQVKRLKSLRKIDETINTSLDLSITTNILLDEIMNQLKIDAAVILLFNPATNSLKYINGRGFTTSALKYTDLKLGQGLAGRAAVERQIVHIPDLRLQSEFFEASPLMKTEKFIEYYGVPLISKGSVKGLLEMFHRSPFKVDESWLEFMETLSGEAAIAIDNVQLFENLVRSNNDLMMAYDATIEGWSRALDLRDKETEGNTRRVTEITVRLAQAFGFQGQNLTYIRWGALLHDIGKMGIPDNILFKPGALSEDEWEVMRKHPDYAFGLLSQIAFLHPALDIPYCHHEKWDGSGYPRGLIGEKIPLVARIFAVVDVWDALTSDRPYRKAWPREKTIQHIKSGSGTHFDPQVVTSFLLDIGKNSTNIF